MMSWKKACIIVTECKASPQGDDLIIFGQFAGDECFINDMATKINSCSDCMESLQLTSVGSKCLAKFCEDGQWYRAVVGSVSVGTCMVKFVDYGHDQITRLRDLKCMPSEFADVKPLCHMFFLQIDGQSPCGYWTNHVEEHLKTNFLYTEIEVDFFKSQNDQFIAKSPDIHRSLLDSGFIVPVIPAAPKQQYPSRQKFSVHQKLNVTINDVLPDGSFFCYDVTSEGAMNNLLDELYGFCTGPNARPLVRASIGQFCCSKYSCDGNWYRAQIVDIDGNKANIKFIDYGNKEKCDVSLLLSLPPKFMSLPIQGIHCILSADRQPSEMMKILHELRDKPVVVEFVNTGLVPFPVRLYHKGSLVGLTIPCGNFVEQQQPESHDETTTRTDSEYASEAGRYSIEVPLNLETPIRITFIENPDRIWVQLIDFQAKLIRLTGTLNGLYNGTQYDAGQLRDVKLGQMCCLRSQRMRHWCRGEVILVCNNSVEVKFVDFGHTEVTHISNIRLLKNEFMKLPYFAICCQLENVVPILEKWCNASVRYLNEFVAKSGLAAKFVSINEGVYAAEIYILTKGDRVVLNKEISERGFGCYSQSGSNVEQIDSPNNPECSNLSLTMPRRYYTYAGVSLVGAQVLVTICADPTPGEFWVLPHKAKLQCTFVQLTTEMSCYMDTTPRRFEELYPGMPCIFLTKDKVLRAAIVSCEDSRSPEVFLVDLGVKSRVSVTSLRPIKPDHVYMVHPLAIRCTMHGIVKPKSNFWSTAAMEAFSEFCRANHKDILCTIHACITDGISELLMARISSPFSNAADALVKMGNCQYVCPLGKLTAPFTLKSFICSNTTGIGKEDTFYVTHAERADLFYCQITDNFEVIDEFMDNVQDYCNSCKKRGVTFHDLVRVPVCFVKYNDNKWYRAHFVSVAPIPSKTFAMVFLVDYGNLVNVLLENIIIFHQESNLADVPMQALPCSLSEIVAQVKDFEKADSILSKMKVLILHKVFPGRVTGSTNGKLHVDLYTDSLQKKRVNSAFAEEISLTLVSPITFNGTENGPILKGQYKDISNTIEVKSCHSVAITSVIDPHEFFVRLESYEEMFNNCCSEVDGLYTAMRRHDCQTSTLQKNDIVCAKHPETLHWCRGVVIDVESCKQNQVLVEFVDFGSKEIVSISDSTKILLPDMQLWPKLAICCRLNNIKPVNGQWTAANKLYFADLCQSTQCRLRFNKRNSLENKWAVDLKVDGTSVARLMVEKKHAVFVIPPNGQTNTDMSVQTKKTKYFEVGEVKKVFISHVESIRSVYLQLVEMQDALALMMEKINQSSETYQTAINPSQTCSYLSRYDEDGRLYRANILSLDVGRRQEIIFVDYGNRSSVEIDQLYFLPNEFSDLPEQAIRCEVLFPSQVDVHKIVSKLENLSADEEISISARCIETSPNFLKMELMLQKNDGVMTKFGDLFAANSVERPLVCQKLSYQKFDVVIGEKLKVFVSQVDGPSQVWLQVSSGTPGLDKLMEEIEGSCVLSDSIDLPKSLAIGMLCLAKYVVDGGWYRGQVAGLIDTENADVLFVDYGNKETVNIKNISTIKDEFLVLPQQAIPCRLRNVHDMSLWDPISTAKFVERVSDVELEACFHRSKDSPDTYDVDLIYPCGKSLNQEWNETINSRSTSGETTEPDSTASQTDETAIYAVKHVVTDRGDHVIVENLVPVSKLDFNTLPDHQMLSCSNLSHSVRDISIDVGALEGGFVSHCEHPGLFYIQLSRFSTTLDDISQELYQMHDTKLNLDGTIQAGDLYIAKSPDDGEWYRGKCVNKEGAFCSIYFIDYGNTSQVSKDDVKTIPSQLVTIPILAIPCRLHDLDLVADSWTNVTDSFLNLTLDQELKVTFMEQCNGIWSVKLALSEEDIADRLIRDHEGEVAHGKIKETEMLTIEVGNDCSIEFGSVLCMKIVKIDSDNEVFHAINLSISSSKLKEAVTRCLLDFGDDISEYRLSFSELDLSSFYLSYVGQNWNCIKILHVEDQKGLAIDLSANQMTEVTDSDKILPCSSDVTRLGRGILISCVLPSNASGDWLGSTVVASFRSQDKDGNWIVDISATCADGDLNNRTKEQFGLAAPNVTFPAFEEERLKLNKWAKENLANLYQLFEISGDLLKNCPDCIRHVFENFISIKNVICGSSVSDATVDCSHINEIAPERTKRTSCDTGEQQHEESPAKKIKLETNKLENWSSAVLSKFRVGDVFEAVITSIVHPGKIFLRPFLLISESITCEYANDNLEDKTKHIFKAKYCLVQTIDALSTIDHWIRGKIIEKQSEFFIFYDMDAGVNVEGTAENIIPVGESLLSWPLFCMECSMTGIKPIDGADSWGMSPTAELNSIVQTLHVSDKVEVTIIGIIISKESGEKVFEVDITINKESLSKRLIAMKVACFADGDKENQGKGLHKGFDGIERGFCRKPLKELGPCMSASHSPLPITPRSVENSLPIFDLLAVPWKVVRTSRELSRSEKLSDSVFVSENEESLLLSTNIGCGTRHLTSFRIYCSHVESESLKNDVAKSPEFLSAVQQFSHESDGVPEGKNAGNQSRCNVNDFGKSTKPDKVNGVATECVQSPSTEREEIVDEMARDLVERILYQLSLEEEGMLSDKIDGPTDSKCSFGLLPAPHTSIPEIDSNDACQYKEESSGDSNTMVDEMSSLNLSSNTPSLQTDVTISCGNDMLLQQHANHQTERELEKAIKLLDMDRSHCDSHQNSLLMNEILGEELEEALDDLDINDTDCNHDVEKAMVPSLEMQELSTMTINMNLVSSNNQIGQYGARKVHGDSAEIVNDCHIKFCSRDLIKESVITNANAIDAVSTLCDAMDALPCSLDTVADSKSQEQYYSAEECIAETLFSNNMGNLQINLEVKTNSSNLGYTQDMEKESKFIHAVEQETVNNEECSEYDLPECASFDLVDSKAKCSPIHFTLGPCDASESETKGQHFDSMNGSTPTDSAPMDLTEKSFPKSCETEDPPACGDIFKIQLCDTDVPQNCDLRIEDDNCQRIEKSVCSQQDMDTYKKVDTSSNHVSMSQQHTTSITHCYDMEGEATESRPIPAKEGSITKLLSDQDSDVCSAEHAHQSFGICCLPKMQIDIGDIASVYFVRVALAPLTVVLQFDDGQESGDWQNAMIKINSPEEIAKLEPCDCFETDMMCLVACPDLSYERGRIIDHANDLHSVELIDHGEIFETQETQLHKLPEFLSIYPRQAIECRLHGIKMDGDEETSRIKWKFDIGPFLKNLLQGKVLRAEIIDSGTDSDMTCSVRVRLQEENGLMRDVSEILANTGMAAVVTGQDEPNSSDDGQWTTINDSSYEELVKGSDTSTIMHSSNADLSVISEAFEEDLPTISQQNVGQMKTPSNSSEIVLNDVARSVYAKAVSGALIVAKFGFGDIVGQPSL